MKISTDLPETSPAPRTGHGSQPEAFSRWSQLLPHALLVAWLIFLALTVWPAVQRTSQPPLYDALTYYQKAMNFWANLHSAKIQNPFDLEPTVRPPGTVLMSYPFGFTQDFHGFYFRSVYMPILLLVLAVYVAAYHPERPVAEQWNVALLAMLMSTLPTFYHFEPIENPSSLYWGLVDGFLTAVAALAMASWLRSAELQSRRWLLAAIFISGFCLLIKPAGAFVMACIGSCWGFDSFMRVWSATGAQRAKAWKYVGFGTAWIAPTYAALVLLCTRSKYISAASISYGRAAIKIMQSELTLPLKSIPSLLPGSLGYPLVFTFALLILLIIARRISGIAKASRMLFAALCCLTFGIWFWIGISGGVTQIRYFTPFAVMALLCLTPMLLIGMERSVPTAMVLRGLWLATVINTAALLLHSSPSPKWQAGSGVTLASGNYAKEVNGAHSFVKTLVGKRDMVVVYSLYSSQGCTAVNSVLQFENLIDKHPPFPTISVMLPIDWHRDTAYRIGEIVSSDYLLLNPVPGPDAATVLSQKNVPDFTTERNVVNAWMSTVGEGDGLQTIFQTDSARVVKITNARRLEESLSRLVASYQWPQSFVEANPQHWWSKQQLIAASRDFPMQIADVRFGDVFHLEALSMRRADDQISIRIWLRTLQATPGDRWFMFIHQLDKGGRLLDGSYLMLPQLQPLDSRQPIVLEADSFTVPQPGSIRNLAVGIFSEAHFLTADKGNRDWGNRRVIIPFAEVP